MPGRGDEAQSEEDQRIRRAFADARDGALAGHWLRQGFEDCALRNGQRPNAEASRAEARFCDRGRIRSRCRPEKNGHSLCRDGCCLMLRLSITGPDLEKNEREVIKMTSTAKR